MQVYTVKLPAGEVAIVEVALSDMPTVRYKGGVDLPRFFGDQSAEFMH
jgi:hypothetical protein